MKYKKKPIIIDAVQLRWNNWSEVCDFLGENLDGEKISGISPDSITLQLKIKTLEGIMVANEKDYIVKGVKGEFYPVKEEIFLMTFEEI